MGLFDALIAVVELPIKIAEDIIETTVEVVEEIFD